MKDKQYGCLSPLALGVSLGIITGLFMMVLAWSGLLWGYGASMVELWGAVYPGYAATGVGGVIGLAWGFLEGFILGLLWGWFYNLCLCCCRCASDTACKPKV